MRLLKGIGLVAALLVLSCGVARADGITDPQIIVSGGVSTTLHITSLNFLITVPNNPGCQQTTGVLNNVVVPVEDCGAINQTGFGITSLTFVFPFNPNLSPLVLGVNTFGATSFTFNPNTGLTTAVFGIGFIPDNTDFHIQFWGFNPGTQFNVAASVPEPGTLALFGTGLMGIAGLVRRKRA